MAPPLLYQRQCTAAGMRCCGRARCAVRPGRRCRAASTRATVLARTACRRLVRAGHRSVAPRTAIDVTSCSCMAQRTESPFRGAGRRHLPQWIDKPNSCGAAPDPWQMPTLAHAESGQTASLITVARAPIGVSVTALSTHMWSRSLHMWSLFRTYVMHAMHATQLSHTVADCDASRMHQSCMCSTLLIPQHVHSHPHGVGHMHVQSCHGRVTSSTCVAVPVFKWCSIIRLSRPVMLQTLYCIRRLSGADLLVPLCTFARTHGM